VVKIFLTYKTGLLILRPTKSKFLSKTGYGKVAGAAGCALEMPKVQQAGCPGREDMQEV